MSEAKTEADSWEAFRERMPITSRYAYFDHAAVAPLSQTVRQAMQDWLAQAVEVGDVAWPQWSATVEGTRGTAAQLINASTNEIALVPNTTTGIGLVAEGLPWRAGDNVVTLANEFPSNQYPWLNLGSRGVETRRVPVTGVAVDLNRIAEHCDERTRVISVSWVGYASGWRVDLDELASLAHERGSLLFVDAIQGLGVFPLDVEKTEIDFLAADGHKWMMGPEGAGMLYVRSCHLDQLRPLLVGWNSVAQSHDYQRIELHFRPSAARFEGGSQNMVGMAGFGASLRELTELGAGYQGGAVATRVLEVTDYAVRRLQEIGASIVSQRDADHRSGIVAFDLPGRDLAEVRRRCLRGNVVLSCRGGWLRIAPHAYNNEDDVERLVEILDGN